MKGKPDGEPKKSLTEQLAARAAKTVVPIEPDASDDPSPAPEDSVTTQNLARRQQQIMLELRFRNGNRLGLGYSYLVSVTFNPSEGIQFDFTGHRVTVTGSNLLPLFKGLLVHKVGSIREADPRAEPEDPTAPVVDSIAVKILGESETP